MKRILNINPEDYGSVSLVKKVVSHYTNVPIEIIESQTRKADAVKARKICFWLCSAKDKIKTRTDRFNNTTVYKQIQRHTEFPLKYIGSSFDRDHSTVMHGRDDIQALLDTWEDNPQWLHEDDKDIIYKIHIIDSRLRQARRDYEKIESDGDRNDNGSHFKRKEIARRKKCTPCFGWDEQLESNF